MTSVRVRAVRRLTVVAAATGLCATGVAGSGGPAAAADAATRSAAAPAAQGAFAGGIPEQRSGAMATLNGLRTSDQAVVTVGGEKQKVGAGLFEMSVDGGGTLQTYGLDALNPIQEQSRYAEGEWKSSSLSGNRNAGKIRWIVEHSYPRRNDLQALAKSAGAKRLTPQTAAAGTQVAIWRFAENGARGVVGDGGRGEGPPKRPLITAADPSAQKLAAYLVKKARSMREPGPSLTFDKAEVSGKSGERPGPVTVRTKAAAVSVAPGPRAASQGVRIVDGKGKRVRTAHNGTKLYFALPEGVEAGSASLTAQTATKVPVGRVLTGAGERGRGQAQIVAGSSQSTVSATAAVNWAARGPLPATTASENCDGSGVDITVLNSGDTAFPLRVGKQREDIAKGKRGTVTVPVAEDQPYRIPVRGPNGYAKTFSGVLDCTTSAAGGGLTQQKAAATVERPATVGGGAAAAGTGDLAETGGGGTRLFTALAIGLLAVGVTTLRILRRRH
ncbi:thioester domain-containing protein [Streptomyces spirodelae]|uniref:Thioester domain-containing protein n=1 Tax=Streptomyces spirodelae TaxID=2812904 RepID=A0ABS3WPG0_9ACTN|nr:thioester domain-containing protein [Streptomyces spirodelae]MBO8184991.1 thioester domain-containing protein [Streptomyces spirodelae]